ncbi:MAG: hypothetical protein HC876_20100 [Chloroflexaceae bacterium]|nr:hypothetical protein [Chloroflexaceae bacterium]
MPWPGHARRRHCHVELCRRTRLEFELAFVIGKGGVNIARDTAMQHVFGYTIYNDFSARAIQSREMSVGLGPAKGKDVVRGHVLGPWLVTADEIADIYKLRLVARVNGDVVCNENSGSMHWKIADMIRACLNGRAIAPRRSVWHGHGRQWLQGRAGRHAQARRCDRAGY